MRSKYAASVLFCRIKIMIFDVKITAECAEMMNAIQSTFDKNFEICAGRQNDRSARANEISAKAMALQLGTAQ